MTPILHSFPLSQLLLLPPIKKATLFFLRIPTIFLIIFHKLRPIYIPLLFISHYSFLFRVTAHHLLIRKKTSKGSLQDAVAEPLVL